MTDVARNPETGAPLAIDTADDALDAADATVAADVSDLTAAEAALAAAQAQVDAARAAADAAAANPPAPVGTIDISSLATQASVDALAAEVAKLVAALPPTPAPGA